MAYVPIKLIQIAYVPIKLIQNGICLMYHLDLQPLQTGEIPWNPETVSMGTSGQGGAERQHRGPSRSRQWAAGESADLMGGEFSELPVNIPMTDPVVW